MRSSFTVRAVVALAPLVLVVATYVALFAALPLMDTVRTAMASDKPLDTAAVIRATTRPFDGVLHIKQNDGTSTWVDPQRKMVTNHEPSDKSLQVETSQGYFDYDRLLQTIYRTDKPRPKDFEIGTYYSAVDRVLRNGVRYTGRTATVNGARTPVYSGTLPARGESTAADVKVYIDPGTDLPVRAEFSPKDGSGPVLVQSFARLSRSRLGQLTFKSFWLGESYGSVKLDSVDAANPEGLWVRFDYADPENPGYNLAIITQDVKARHGTSPTTVPEPENARVVERDGLKVTYLEQDGPGDYPTQYAAFDTGRSSVMIQLQGRVLGPDGEPVSALDVVGALRVAR